VTKYAAGILVAAALAAPAVALAGFTPNDPLASRQWYLTQDRVFNAFDVLPALKPVRVAVIDSGVDAGHPELKGRIIEAKSFVGGTAGDDLGHGTFVAGEIAALTDNGRGIAGLAPPAHLLVAKVVRDDGSISPRAEARAIRWAVREGARLINLSFGSLRSPVGSDNSFSYVEQRAVRYAVAKDVLVVASVGNGDAAPSTPWPYADYPAALPHVLGVAAYARSGDVPRFSNRDDVYVDLAAPGQDMLSLFPRALTARNPSCAEQGYSSCGPKDYRHADGTSFSSPQVTAAAAMLLGRAPGLQADQVSNLLERAALDATPANGCDACSAGRDSLTGFGRLDVTAAIRDVTKPPPPDRFEPNDDVGLRAATGYPRRFKATLDSWDDPNDVYRIRLRRGQRVSVLARSADTDVSLVLWKPALHSLAAPRASLRARRSIHPPGAPERLAYRARRGGWYSLQVKLAQSGMGFGQYSIRIARS
jgi:subtilisin family serine protease